MTKSDSIDTPQRLPDYYDGFRDAPASAGRATNTIESYLYDLDILNRLIGDRDVATLTAEDIALFLADATSMTTRKRRLTSLRAFVLYLINDLNMIDEDITLSFTPHKLSPTPPQYLNTSDQQALLRAATEDAAWSATAIWLMMHLGVGRSELLALERDHIDRTSPDGAEITIAYDAAGNSQKQRTLKANSEFDELYGTYLEQSGRGSQLFPFGPQAINSMVARVAKAAGINHRVTPQLLRHTAAVMMAADGYSINELLQRLGMNYDARNREAIRRYMKASQQFRSTDKTLPEDQESRSSK